MCTTIVLSPQLQDTSITSRFLIGLMAGSMASVSNLPIDVAKSRIQGPQPQNHPNKYRKTLATIRIVFKEEGYDCIVCWIIHTRCTSVCVLIGASVSEPHTSELNCGLSLIYVYIYICIVRCTSSARVCTLRTDYYGYYTCASTTRACTLESSVPNNSLV